MPKSSEPFLIPINYSIDVKGSLGAIDDRQIPFEIARVFWIHEVSEGEVRGGHAHKTSEQLLICVSGSINVFMEDLSGREYHYELNSESEALYLPPLYWGRYEFFNSTVGLCLASDYYSESDYIRDYQEFERLKHVGPN